MRSNLTNTSSRTTDNTLKVHAIVLLVIDTPIAFMTIIGNGMFLITLFAKRHLHTPANILLGALAFSDLLVGIVAQPLWICELSFTVSGKEPNPFFNINYLVIWGLILFSFLFIDLVSVDRYIAVCFPMWYHARTTCKRHITIATFLLVLFLTGYCIGQIIIFKTDNLVLEKFYMTLMGISLILTGFCNFKVFREVRKQQIRIRESSVEENYTSVPNTREENHKSLIVPIITFLCYACYSPMCIVHGIMYSSAIFSDIGGQIALLWTEFMVLLNSFANPIAYYARMKKFREAAISLFCHSREDLIQPT